MTTPETPTVTLGLPVYNGENFLRSALDTALDQTYDDYRIVISDNASTDQTEEICRNYAADHPIIDYHRVEENQGAAWNFRRVFELSNSPYFKWLAHDDLISPGFVTRCVEALEHDPSAVLAFPLASMIDATGAVTQEPEYSIATNSERPSDRFRDLVFSSDQCFEVFGLIRTEALARTQVMGSYAHGDGVLLAHLALMGRFHLVSERLFMSRQHESQSIRVHGGGFDVGRPDYHAYTSWFDPSRSGRFSLPNWRILAEYGRALATTKISWRDRLMAFSVLIRWAKRHRSQLGSDLVTAARQIIRR